MNTSNSSRSGIAFHYVVIVVMALAMSGSLAKAASYATALTNSSGVISFILNEPALVVKIISNGGATTNDLGALPKGLHTTANLGIAGVYKVEVNSSAVAGYTQSSDDANTLNRFNSPRGVAVNQSPSSPAFGRIYVANSAAGTPAPRGAIGDGIYMLNADQSDALGLGDTVSTADIDFSASASDPWKIAHNSADDRLYINNFSTANACTWSTDNSVSSGSSIQILDTLGTSNPGVHTDSASTPVVRGSIAGNDLVFITVDGSAAGHFNQIARWDIGGGPLPWSTPPLYLAYADRSPNNLGVAALNTDVELGPDGKYYTSINRSAGTDTASVKVYDTDGLTLLWSSLVAGGSPDVLRLARAFALSPDGKSLAIIHDGNGITVVPLTNGIPDLPNRISVVSTPTTTIGRDIAFDAAGNIYTVSSGQLLLRVFSVGGPRIATTGSDGTFNIETPIPLVSVASADSAAAETGPDTAEFTVTRSGSTGSALIVNYAMSGTASNGIDYVILSGSVTIPSGASSTNVTLTPINDSVAELAETAVFTLVTNDNYIVENPKTATATIDDNETPELSITAAQPTVAEFGTAAPFKVTRRGDVNVDLATVNLTYSGGAAGGGIDYSGPASISIASGIVEQTVSIDVTDDSGLETNETIICNLTPGSGYTVGAPNSATTIILDDDAALPPGVLFSSDFELDVAPLWNVNKANNTNGNIADFSFDYSTVGIPPAPNSGGTTKGLKLQANLTGDIFGGLSVSPKNRNLSGDYVVTFDMWINFHGPFPGGGNGSTHVTGAGIGTAGTTAQWAGSGGGQDSVHFGATGDGGSGVDYRAYSSAATTGYLPPSGVFAAGVSTTPDSRNNSDIYYAPLGGETAPAGQLALFPNQTGTTAVGSAGMAWRQVTITVTNNMANYSIDGLSIATVDLSTVVLGGGSILLNQYDINDASSLDTNKFAMHFGLFDNVKVAIPSLPAIEITSIQINGADVVINFTDASSETTAPFTLQSSTNVAGTYATDNSALFSGSSGTFSVTTAVNGATQFYQIKRNP